ncbi:MAG: tRNA 2-thiocytidine(32) synthetase TtcA [Myxococcota bacterium]
MTPSELHRLRRRIGRDVGDAIADFSMIEEGDRILAAVSGGKDSYVMHEVLTDLQRRAPVSFEVLALNVDQGHPGYPRERLHAYMDAHGHAFRMVHEDTYSVVKAKVPEGKTTCSLCSRLRRGILYTAARRLGCNKIALGHHREDIIATLMMNLLFQGQLKAMPPKLVNDAGDVVVIRPLAYCPEERIGAYAAARAYPIIPCVLCSGQMNHQRRIVGELLADLDRRRPGVRASMLAATRQVRPSQLLDAGLWRDLELEVAREGPETPEPTAEPLLQLGRRRSAPPASREDVRGDR